MLNNNGICESYELDPNDNDDDDDIATIDEVPLPKCTRNRKPVSRLSLTTRVFFI